MDGVGRENADSLLLTGTGVEHLEAAGPPQGGAVRGCQCRFYGGDVEAVSLPTLRKCRVGIRKKEKEAYQLGV